MVAVFSSWSWSVAMLVPMASSSSKWTPTCTSTSRRSYKGGGAMRGGGAIRAGGAIKVGGAIGWEEV